MRMCVVCTLRSRSSGLPIRPLQPLLLIFILLILLHALDEALEVVLQALNCPAAIPSTGQFWVDSDSDDPGSREEWKLLVLELLTHCPRNHIALER